MGCGSVDVSSLQPVACLRKQRNLLSASTGCSHEQLTVSFTFPCINFDPIVLWARSSCPYTSSHRMAERLVLVCGFSFLQQITPPPSSTLISLCIPHPLSQPNAPRPSQPGLLASTPRIFTSPRHLNQRTSTVPHARPNPSCFKFC